MTNEEIINNWLSSVNSDLIKKYNELGLRASGNWANQLEEFQEKTSKGFKLGIKGEQYTGALEHGRAKTSTNTAGNPTLREIIREWIDVKRITPKDNISKDSLAFLIARKIHEEGIKVPNEEYNKGGLVSDVITKDKIKELGDSLTLSFVNSFKSDVIKVIK